MKLYYGRNAEAAPDGAAFRNLRLFREPEAKASEVFLSEPDLRIIAAYEGLGITVTRLDTVAPPVDPEAVFAPAETVTIPGDWRDLPFQKADERGFSLRGIAEALTSCPVKTTAAATGIIESYLTGTARPDDADEPLEGADGLTRAELNADLESAKLEIVPGETGASIMKRLKAAK